MRQAVVTNPPFEQVAQNKNGICAGAVHVVTPGGKSGAISGLQMQVGDEIYTMPVRGCL